MNVVCDWFYLLWVVGALLGTGHWLFALFCSSMLYNGYSFGYNVRPNAFSIKS